jgi:hypothetical protein
MPLSYQLFTATSGQTVFLFTFPVLSNDHVKVSIDGTDLTGTQYTVSSSPSPRVTLTTGATAGQVVRVYRKTPGRETGASVNLVDFVNGSVLSEEDLDKSNKQLLYLLQESDDTGTGALNKNNSETHWDAESLKIENLATPTANNDAVNKTYVDTKVSTDAMTLSGGHWDGESRRINNVADPSTAQDATTKNYVDSKFASDAMVLSGGNWDGENRRITNVASPTNVNDAASKAYVDGVTFYTGGGLATPQSWVFSGNGSLTTFALASPDPLSSDAQQFLVEVGGVIQRPTTNYSISGSNLTFVTAPPAGTNNIVVRNFGAVRNVASFADNVTFSQNATVTNNLTVGNQLIGGIGARTTGGVNNWNDITNARSGNGASVLLDTHTNGFSSFGSGSEYFHPFTFEYSSKDGSGTMTQFAIPYDNPVDGIHLRSRYLGNWTGWHSLVVQPNAATPAIFVNSGGNVGINTKSPAAKLTVDNGAIHVVDSVAGGAATTLRLRNSSDTAGAENVLQMPVHNNTTGLQIRQSSSGVAPRPAWDTGSYDAFIRTGQNNSKLHLAGGQSSATPHLTIDGGGNVGIGTSSPVSELQVAASSGVNNYATFGNTAANNLTVGYSGGDYSGIGFNLKYTPTNDSWQYRDADRASLLRWTDGGFDFWGTATTGTANTAANLTRSASLNKNGNFVVGPLASASARIHAHSSTAEAVYGLYTNSTTGSTLNDGLRVGVDSAGTSFVWNSETSSMLFGTQNTERMRISAAGDLLLGTNAPIGGSGNTSRGFTVSAPAVANNFAWLAYDGNYGIYLQQLVTSNDKGWAAFLGGSTTMGLIRQISGALAYSVTSDYRLKTDIVGLTGSLDRISQLKPCEFTWKDSGLRCEGFIAHELQDFVPTAVAGEKDAVEEDGSIKAQCVDLAKVVPLLTAAIQELKAIVEAQAARISALESAQ